MMKNLPIYFAILFMCLASSIGINAQELILGQLPDTTVQCVEDIAKNISFDNVERSNYFFESDPNCLLSSQGEMGLSLDCASKINTCTLTDAGFEPSNDPWPTGADVWAFWLPELVELGIAPTANWVFDTSGFYSNDARFQQVVNTLNRGEDIKGGVMNEYQILGLNIAHIYGIVVNDENPDLAFFVSVILINGVDWETWSSNGGAYLDAVQPPGDFHEDWLYYVLFDKAFSNTFKPGAFMLGLGDLEGYLTLDHKPTNHLFGFQSGVGANNKNRKDGVSGWFAFEGELGNINQPNNGLVSVVGEGDLNVNKECTPTPPEPVDGCTNDKEYCIFYLVEDECNTTGTIIRRVTVKDATPPLMDCPADTTIYCSNWPIDVPTVTAIDNCSDDTDSVVVTYLGETLVSEEGSCSRIFERSWTVEDCVGNRDTCTQTLNVISTPVFTFVPEDATYQCDAPSSFEEAIATNDCDEVTLETTEDIIPSNCPQEYTIVRTFTATDLCGNSTVEQQVINVVDTVGPVFDPFEVSTSVLCTEYESLADLTATDECGSVSMEKVETTASGSCLGGYLRTFIATDECGNRTVVNQYVALIDNVPPEITVPENMTFECNETIPSPPVIEATDNCSEDPLVMFEIEEFEISECEKDIHWTWTAMDVCGNKTVQTTIIQVRDTTAPTWGEFEDEITISCEEDFPDCDATEPPVADNCNSFTITCVDEVRSGECLEFLTRTYRAEDACGNVSEPCVITIFKEDREPPSIEVPNDQTIEWTGEGGLPTVEEQEEQIIIDDNCTSVSLILKSETTDTLDCLGNLRITRCWTATDACGNSSEDCITITTEDTTAPVFDCVANGTCPQDITLSGCNNEIPPAPELTATDACDPNVEITVRSTIGVGSTSCGEDSDSEVACDFFEEYVYTARDECGNVSTYIYTVHYTVDTIAPVWGDFERAIEVSCSDDFLSCESTQPPIFDNCDGCAIEVFCDDIPASGGCIDNRLRKYWAIDACGNVSDTCEIIIITVDDEPPSIEVPVDLTVEWTEDGSVPTVEEQEEQIIIDDNCTSVTLTLKSETIDTLECLGNLSITRCWTAEDACGNSIEDCVTITTEDTTAPVFDCVANGTCPPDITLSGCNNEIPPAPELTATDACDPNIEVRVTFTTRVGSTSCGVDSDSEEPCDFIREYVYTARDECGNVDTYIYTVRYTVDTIAPVWGDFPSKIEVKCGEAFPSCADTEPEVFDNCDGCDIEIICTEEQAAGCIDTRIRTYIAIDACGNESAPCEIIIDTVDDEPPSIEVPVDLTVEWTGESSVPTVESQREQIIIDDNCTSISLTLTSEKIDTLDCLGNLIITRCWTAEDACGNSIEDCVTITTEDTTAPVFDCVANGTCPPDITLSGCNNEIPPAPELTATDACDPNVDITVRSTVGVASTSCGEDSDSEVPCDFFEEYVYTARDECGNVSTYSYTVHYTVDTIAPIWGVFPETIEVRCDGDTLSCADTQPEIFDNCEDCDLEVFCEDNVVSGGCIENRIRSYWAIDECGNSSDTIEIIFITVDDVPPSFTSFPTDVTVEWTGDGTIPSVAQHESEMSFEDDCTDVILTLVGETIDTLSCLGNRTIRRCWTIEDLCGNVSGQRCVTVTTEDTTDPIFDCITNGNCPGDIVIDCSESIPAPVELTASDNCSDPTVTVSTGTSSSMCPLVTTYTYTARDDCGNTASYSYTITSEDNSPPVVIINNPNITIECGTEIPDISYEETDNCSSNIDVDVEESIMTDPECPSESFVITRTLTARDLCGNTSAPQTQVIRVVDTTGPTFNTPVPEDQELACTDPLPPPANLGATDNCSEEVEISFKETFFGEVPPEGAVEHCSLELPTSEVESCFAAGAPDWAMVLPDFPLGYEYYNILSGSFTEFDDGTASITARLQSFDNPNGQWDLTLHLSESYSWSEWEAKGSSFKDDCDFSSSRSGLFESWIYYIFDESQMSSLVGRGDFAGSSLSLTQAPENKFFGYQVGVGANNVNINYGSGGWFFYEGDFVEISSSTSMSISSNLGDFAFEHDCCPQYGVVREWCATDCVGNVTCIEQEIYYEGFDFDSYNSESEEELKDQELDFFAEPIPVPNVSPNPSSGMFVVQFETHPATTYPTVLNVYNIRGQLIRSITTSLDVNEHNIVVDLHDYEKGLYFVELRSQRGTRATKVMLQF